MSANLIEHLKQVEDFRPKDGQRHRRISKVLYSALIPYIAKKKVASQL
ncbi:hypothetical protein LC609_21930 [Nostoc sp. XA013]|nr:hypothetical protein [Nostoc sp. XA013]